MIKASSILKGVAYALIGQGAYVLCGVVFGALGQQWPPFWPSTELLDEIYKSTSPNDNSGLGFAVIGIAIIMVSLLLGVAGLILLLIVPRYQRRRESQASNPIRSP